MKPARFRLFSSGFRLPALLAALPTPGSAAGPAKSTEETESERPAFTFSLLPKSLQRNPRLDLNVITEMTPDGKKLPLPSPASPAYYITYPGGYMQVGQAPPAGEKSPPVADLERVMQKALAKNSYLASGPGHPPSLALIYHWGSHSNLNEDGQAVADRATAADAAAANGDIAPAENPVIFAEDQIQYAMTDLAKRKDLIERAALVGGTKFADQLEKVIEQQIQYSDATGPQVHLAPGGKPILGDMQTTFVDFSSPFERFLRSDPQVEHLIEESFSTCYFVIASAYDYTELGKGHRKLLWRTKMTVNADGVALKDTLPTLVITAGRFFGREMNGAATVSRRLMREGEVQIGTPTVVEFPATSTSTAPAKKPEGKP